MPTFTTSQEWLHQSQLLLEARPSTTRITTRYSIRRAERKPAKDGEALPDAKPPRARLVLKTYDDASGACLKYRTSKADSAGSAAQAQAGASQPPAQQQGGAAGGGKGKKKKAKR